MTIDISGGVKSISAGGASVLASSISDGDTTHAPDGNSVFDALALKLDTTKSIWTAATKLTLASDAVTVTQSLHTIEVQTGSTDDLSTISGGAAGQLLAIRADDTTETVVVKHNVGNILTAGSDITLDDTNKYVLFVYDGTLSKWVVIGGTGGGAGVTYATAAEINTGTEAAKAIAPDQLAASAPTLSGLTVQDGLTTTGAILTLSSEETSTVLNDVLGRINFKAGLDAAGTDAILPGASIAAVAENTFSSSVNETGLAFSTGASEVAVERMRIDHHGRVGIETTVFGTNNKLLVNPYNTIDNLASAQINSTSATNKGLVVQGFTSQSARLQEWQDSSGTVVASISSIGELQIGNTGADVVQLAHGGPNLYLRDGNGNPSKLIFYSDVGLERTSAGILKVNNGSTEWGTLIAGSVGIGTLAPASPLAVNRQADDGVVIDIEQADTVEGTISVSGNTVSYNAFVGSHYTQLKNTQSELPVGAVVISTGEIIPCQKTKPLLVEVLYVEAVNIITKAQARDRYDVVEEDRDNIISTETTYEYDPETDTTKEVNVHTYGTKIVTHKRLKEDCYHNRITQEFFKVKAGYRYKEKKFYRVDSEIVEYPNKEYFVYVDTTSTPADRKVYGVWMGKMRDDAEGMSFGKQNKSVYLVAQVGLFKIRVTDTNGDIGNGNFLESSSRPMEAQKQTGVNRANSTVAKALTNVTWASEVVDPVLGYKWKLIPCVF